MNQTNYLRSLWIIILSILGTGYICAAAIYQRAFKTITRSWVDNKLKIWKNFLLKLVKIKLIINNPCNIQPIPDRATIVMCNHTSLYDIPLSLSVFPQSSMRMLAKKELHKIPIMGKGMDAAEFIFIDRKNRKQALRDLDVMTKLLKSGIVMWVAPEGTRSKNGNLGNFKKGAFITALETNAVIIPIVIIGANKILASKSCNININQEITINVGNIIDTYNFSTENSNTLMTTVYTEMQSLLNLQPAENL